MNIDKTKLTSVVLTLLLVTSVLPAGIVGFSETARADHGEWYTLRQPGAGVCHEVQAYTVDHPKMEPEVDVRGEIEPYEEPREADVYGDFRDPDWNGFVSIESIMDYRYRYTPNDSEHAVGQTPYYAPYLNTQYRHEPWEYGTYGLYNWSDNGDSHMFFYENARGEVSLVVRHDRQNDETGISSHSPYNGIHGPHDGFHEDSPGGGAVTWDFQNLPRGEWAYIDDMYPRENMDDYYVDRAGNRYGHREAEYEAEWLQNFTGGYFHIEWYWGPDGTDGGAYRGFHNLGASESVTINPREFSNIEQWEVRNNTGHADMNGTLQELDMDSQLIIQRGRQCPESDLGVEPDADVENGETVTFVAEADYSVDAYRWDLDGDGEIDETTSSPRLDYTINSTAHRTASVTLVTAAGGEIEETVDVRAYPNEPPDAILSVEAGDRGLDEYHIVGEQLTFDASNSTDRGGLSSTVQWDFGDGTTRSAGDRVTHSFDEPGTYEVTVEVSDTAGNNDTATRTVEIHEPDEDAPTARAAVEPQPVEAGAPFTLKANDSDDERGIASYAWDLNGDGSGDVGGEQATHSFGSAGTYNVTLTVADGGGNTNTTTVPVEVAPAEAPDIESVSIPERVTAGQQFELAADATDEGRIAEYQWIAGGEVVATGQRATHTISSERTDQFGYQIQLRVVDAAGQANATAPQTITVYPEDNTPPNASLSASTDDTRVDETVTFDASNSTDEPHRAIDTYHWNFDGDNETDRSTDEPVVEHSYDSQGTYNATVTVEDSSGNVDEATVRIEVDPEQQPKRGSGSGGSTSSGPPPVVKEVEQRDGSGATVDVRNARSENSVYASLPDNVAAGGLEIESLEVELASDDPHVAFRTDASAAAPEGTAAPSDADATLGYVDFDAEYLDDGIDNATVEFAVQKSELAAQTSASDLTVYERNGSWERVNTSVVDETSDAYHLEATTDDLGVLAVGAERSLAVTDADLASETVVEGEQVEATATVENAGESAESVTLSLTLDDETVATETVDVPAGDTADVALSGAVNATGTYEVTVNGAAAGSVTVEQADPADLAVSDLSLNASSIAAGERVEITATVENAGDRTGERNVTLRMFGNEVGTKTVEVPGGETKTVSFVQRVDAAGSHAVKVGDASATLEVTEQSGDDGVEAPDVPGFGIGTALVALLAAALLARFRG